MIARHTVFRLCLLAFAFVALGCVKRSVPQTEEISQQQQSAVSEELLRSVVANLQSSFDDSAFSSAIDQLNQYLKRNVGVLSPWRDQDQIRAVGLIGSSGANLAKQSEYVAEDAAYLKSTLFLRSAARVLQGSDPDSLSIAGNLFSWLTQEVDYLPPGWQPGGLPVDVCIRGAGSGNERAWIFLELLRQAGLQGCMVGIPTPGGEGILPWLCGVIVEGEVYLFEPALGVPLYAADGKIATLKQLGQRPDLIKDFSSPDGPPYWVAPDQVKDFSLLLVVQAQMLAPRMQFLEERLSGALRVNLVLKLEESLGIAREALEGLANNQGVRVWQYPQIASSQFSGNRSAFFRSVNLAWFRDPRSPRLLQLRGEYEEAIQGYVRIDMESSSAQELDEVMKQLPLEVRRNVIGLTPQDVLYFTGVCQLFQDRSQPGVAEDWFRRYRERFGDFRFRADDIIDLFPLAGALGKEDGEANRSVQRVRELLLPPERDLALAVDFRPMAELLIAFDEPKEKVATLLRSMTDRTMAWDSSAAKLQKNASADAAQALVGEWKAFTELASDRMKLREESERLANTGSATEDQLLELQVKLARNREALVTAVRAANGTGTRYITVILNNLLTNRDLYQPDAFEEVFGKSSADGELRALLEQEEGKLSELQVERRNRLLLSSTFPESIVIGRRPWIAASIRMSAAVLYQQGKTDEAIELLTTAHPALLAVERAPLFAVANCYRQKRNTSAQASTEGTK